ncbi:T9SS type A sorting domain-containing protein [Saccharicrinis sp. FJH54]|uniref:T9SS type A sorting domain-containing protein n=1 Tax=Saccharicrinis sp. FJH54 TaxID=3344665 RepID=UPI0035D4358C
MNPEKRIPLHKNATLRLRLSALYMLIMVLSFSAKAATGTWNSSVTGGSINYLTTNSENQAVDLAGKKMTVVYLENLGFDKIGQNTNAEDVAWLLSQGYQVIELDYAGSADAISPKINNDIIAINDEINNGSFCGLNDCSTTRSYILFEGYRIARDVSYFKNDPKVYNWPTSNGPLDSLYMDIVYPANADVKVPVVLSFSYSNSYYEKSTNNKRHFRLFLGYTLAMFDDSFLEGAPAKGIAWAIADHPKYCDWGKGKPIEGDDKDYGGYEVNPDAAQKVKSAVRTLRVAGDTLGLSGKIGIYGFSRGSDAGSMAIGDKTVEEFENAGNHIGVSDDVQAAALGSGVFDFTQIFNSLDDGDGNLESKCPKVWGPLDSNRALWESMGSANLVQTSATSPVMFFYNTGDAHYYQDQIQHLKEKLESLDVPVSTITDYGNGFGDLTNNTHGVPKDTASLAKLYAFFNEYLATASDTTNTAIQAPSISTDNLSVTVSPNPASNELRLMVDLATTGNLKIEVCNLSGMVLYKTEKYYNRTGRINETINLNSINLPQGIYMLKVYSEDQQSISKFVKKG